MDYYFIIHVPEEELLEFPEPETTFPLQPPHQKPPEIITKGTTEIAQQKGEGKPTVTETSSLQRSESPLQPHTVSAAIPSLLHMNIPIPEIYAIPPKREQTTHCNDERSREEQGQEGRIQTGTKENSSSNPRRRRSRWWQTAC